MKFLYAAAWSPGRKNRLKMMSSSKSFLALSFHLMPSVPCPTDVRLLKMPRIYLASWTDAIFMTLLLFFFFFFYHGNSFESIYQSAAAIRRVALKDQVQVIPSLHFGTLRWKGRRRRWREREGKEKKKYSPRCCCVLYEMLLKELSKHALASLTPHPRPSSITLSLRACCRDFLLSIGAWWRLGGFVCVFVGVCREWGWGIIRVSLVSQVCLRVWALLIPKLQLIKA